MQKLRLLRQLRRPALAAAGASFAAAYAYAYAEPQARPSVHRRHSVKATEDPRSIELLVHNISHSDLVVTLSDGEQRTYLARPMFNEFRATSEAIMLAMDKMRAAGAPPTLLECLSQYKVPYKLGFDLTSEVASVQLDETPDATASPASLWRRFHLKGHKRHDGGWTPVPSDTPPRVVSVAVPLIAVLLPEWMRGLKRKAVHQNDPPPKKVLVLVSGAGQPRDRDAEPRDNSTEGVGRVIEAFVRAAYPDIEVRHISSDHAARSAATIFRYDDNVQFVKEQVLPVVDSYRTEALAQHGEDWAKQLHVTISLADGAPARISALNASLRSYRPDYLHIWRMKTYWDSQVLCEEDVEFHSFRKLETRPPIHRTQLPAAERAMVEEMIKYKRQFEAVRDLSMHELGSFWLRKTHKVVMAVLLTQKNGQPPVYWRGMNVEVSMPTGTLCAERNAIGNALAGDQTLCRKDMAYVAVLSMDLTPPGGGGGGGGGSGGGGGGGGGGGRVLHANSDDAAEVAMNPLDPCGACMEWLKKIGEVNPDFKVVTFADSSCEHVYITPIGDYA